jgi:hypothetical protein
MEEKKVTPEMIAFANEYTFWFISVGQNYVNALSPNFTTKSSMDIFIENYYLKNWMNGTISK